MEALAFLRGREGNGGMGQPDLILLDLNLPKKNGLEVLTELKASESLRKIPVVMFSTSSAEDDVNGALEGGAKAYITKPSSFDLFVEAVRTAFSLKQLPGHEPD
jgi:two-component system response regulator